MISRMLRDHGCRTLHLARNARDSLDLFDVTAGRLDLVVCAFELPKVNGLAVIKALRMKRTPGLARTPAVMFHPKPDAILKARAAELDIGFVFGLPVAAYGLCETLAALIAGPTLSLRPADDYAAVSVDWAPAAEPVSELRGLTAREAALAAARRRAAEYEEERDAAAIDRDYVLASDLADAAGRVLMRRGDPVTPGVMSALIEQGRLEPGARVRVALPILPLPAAS